MIVLSRVDSRLVHGQVIEAWLPHTRAERIVVIDDAAATDAIARTAMGLAIPDRVQLSISAVGDVDFAALLEDPRRTLVLFRDVASLLRARARGFSASSINLGNVHAGPGRSQLSRSVFLSPEEMGRLQDLAREGAAIAAQAIPQDAPVRVG